jgi:hypothetical protein
VVALYAHCGKGTWFVEKIHLVSYRDMRDRASALKADHACTDASYRPGNSGIVGIGIRAIVGVTWSFQLWSGAAIDCYEQHY